MLDRSVAPPAHAVEHVQLVEATSHHLSNGIPLFLLQAGQQPVMRLEIVFEAGKRYEASPGVSYFTAKMLLEGTLHRTSKAIWDHFEGLGVFAEVTPGFDNITLTIHLLSKSLSKILPILSEIITEPRFGDEELDNLKNIKRQQLKVDLDRNNFLASRKFRAVIFGNNHAYGRSLEMQHIDDIDRGLLQTHFNSHMLGTFKIFIAGQWDEDVVALLERHLGPIELSTQKQPQPQQPKYQPQEYLLERSESLQSTLRVGMPMINRSHEDYFKVMITNEVLGGYFGSRLMKNIREEKGYTYGIHSALSHLSQGSMWIIGTEVKKEFRAPTLFELRREIKKLQQEPIEREELNTVTSYLAGAFASEVDSPFALADKFKMIHFADLDYHYYQDFFQSLKVITPNDILETSRRYFKLEQLSQVIVG